MDKNIELFQKGNKDVRWTTAWKTTNSDLLDYILRNETDLSVLNVAICNEALSDATVDYILASNDTFKLKILASRSNVTSDQLDRVSQVPNLADEILLDILSHYKTPLSVLQRNIHTTFENRLRIATNPNLDFATAQVMLGLNEPEVELELLRHIPFSDADFRKYAAYNNEHYDYAMSLNHYVSTDILESIANNDYGTQTIQATSSLGRPYKFLVESAIKVNVARNKQITQSIADVVLKLEREDVTIALLQNENCPLEVLELMARSKNGDFRLMIARNISTPTAVLEILANDKLVSVRNAVPHNPNYDAQQVDIKLSPFEQKIADLTEAINEEELEPYLNDKSMRVRGAAWFRMYELGYIGFDDIRWKIKRDGLQACINHWIEHRLKMLGVSHPTFIKLAIMLDADRALAEGVASGDIKKEDDILLLLHHHNLPLTIWEIVRHVDLTTEMLDLLVECPKQSGSEFFYKTQANELGVVDYGTYLVRYPQVIVASHKKTSPETLEKLWKKNERYVKTALLKRSDTEPAVLAKFAKRSDEWMREAVADNPNTPYDVLVELRNDPNENVARTAKYTLQEINGE